MRSIRLPAVRPALAAVRVARLVVAASLIAGAVVALSGGPASAAPAPACPAGPVGMTWHLLTLLNGWESANNEYGTGDPCWAVRDGIVYLSGSLTLPGGTPSSSAVAAALPQAAQPFQEIGAVTYTVDGTQGFVAASVYGKLMVSSPNSTDAQQYTSLAGISYPAASTGTTLLPTVNGWQGLDTTLGWVNPAWTQTAGTIHLTGALTNVGSGSVPEFSALPAAEQPAHAAYFSVPLYDDNIGVVLVEPDGTMQVTGTGIADLTELGGVNFTTAETAVTPLNLLDGWQSAQGIYNTGDPGYSVADGIVHLSGSLTQPTPDGTEFAVLPPSARPSHYLYITTYAFDGTAGAVLVTPAGGMYAFGPDNTDTQEYTSLAGIIFPAGS